LQANSIALGI